MTAINSTTEGRQEISSYSFDPLLTDASDPDVSTNPDDDDHVVIGFRRLR